MDAAGDLFIADHGNSRIREVNAATGKITTITGNGTSGLSGRAAQNYSLEKPVRRRPGTTAAVRTLYRCG